MEEIVNKSVKRPDISLRVKFSVNNYCLCGVSNYSTSSFILF